MYRLIIILELVFGISFAALFFPIFVFRQKLFSDDVFVLIGLAVVLTLLFLIGGFVAPEDKSLPTPTTQTPGQELLILSATFTILGVFSFFAEDHIFCGPSIGLICKLIRMVTVQSFGALALSSAISLVFILLGAFFGAWSLWLRRTSGQAKL